MEQLLDEADALVLTSGDSGQPERPNFSIPEECLPFSEPRDVLELKEHPTKGLGWVAKKDLPAGTILLVAKPITMALDWEWDPEADLPSTGGGAMDEDEEEQEEEATESGPEPEDSQINELLVLQLLQDIKHDPSLWTDKVSKLYPRDSVDIQASPVWVSRDDDIFSQFEILLSECETIPALHGKTQEMSARLPLIVRYNVLSIETCSEMLSYPGPTGHASLGGVGLYYLPSFFNHDAKPNVSRYAVGDIMWFVANQDITTGQEACISYIEHDILCESPYRRNLVMTLDFKEDADVDRDADDAEGPEMPVVDGEVQSELMRMDPFERLENIETLLKQASGESLPDDELAEEDAMEAGGGGTWFQCDLHNLRILKAVTFDGMGLSKRALPIWEECVQFAETQLPPNDENSTVMRVQAALCAWHLKEESKARQHASVALARHQLMFGGGVRRFRRRFQKDFSLALRQDSSAGHEGEAPSYEILWPL